MPGLVLFPAPMHARQTLPAIVVGLLALSLAAGKEVMRIYHGAHSARRKEDDSPVTEADLSSEAIILKGLQNLAPEIPVVSEEQTAMGKTKAPGQRFFLVDPLDGTKEFLGRNGEFTINIALVDGGRPVVGVVYAPAIPRLFWSDTTLGAFEAGLAKDGTLRDALDRKLQVSPVAKMGLRVVASRSHRDERTDAWLQTQNVDTLVSAGSSLKFCLVASGEADIYPRFGPTMEWDTAAGHAILEAAGGTLKAEDGTPFAYGKHNRGYLNPAFIARGA